MIRTGAMFRRRWPALAAISVLMAVALATGTLFAANEWQRQSELPTTGQQSVVDVTDPVPAVEPPSAPPAPERVPAQPDDQQVEIDLPPIVKLPPPTYPNLDSNLNYLAEQAQAAEQQPDSTDGSAPGSVPAPPAEPVLVTFYIEPEQVAAVQQYLEDNDVYIRHVGEDWIEAHVPPALLPAVSELPGVRRVDTVVLPEPEQSSGRVVSQGVALHHADDWHRMGYRGQGIKVGILDSFEDFGRLQRSGELPANVIARCYSYDPPRPVSPTLADCEARSNHGTRVAEAIIDVAPEIELYIANAGSSGDIRDAVDWMVQNGVDVINHSRSYYHQGPGDGTSYFGNGVINSVDAAVAGGIVWVNSSGNQAKRVWYGRFNDPDGNSVLNFASRDSGNGFYLAFSEDEGSDIYANMRWDDSWGGADCNLDLHLAKRGSDGRYRGVRSDNEVQDGEGSDIPRASVAFEVPSASEQGIYALFVTKENCADEPDWIQLRVSNSSPQLQYYSPGHHIGNSSETQNRGMLGVGAAHWESPQAIASYSNQGPTIDGRIKPDITGIACGRTSLRNPRSSDGTECWFSGTSQAAPHVAGLAALVRQRFPDYTPEQVTAYLKKHANDHERGPLGADNTWGHGLASLPPGPEPVRRGPPPTVNFEVRPGQNPDEAIISWDPVPEAMHYRIGYVNMEVDFHLATQASCTNEPDDWLQAFVYVDVKAPNVPIKDGRAEYTIRRLVPGARHAFAVLTSDNLYNNRLNVGAEFSWQQNPSRWKFLDGRRDLPPGVVVPQLDCGP